MRRLLALVAIIAGLSVIAPVNAMAFTKLGGYTSTTAIPSQLNLRKPAVPMEPDRPFNASESDGVTRNRLDFTGFDDGDFIVVGGNSLTGHCGEWDDARHSDLNSWCVWSANTKPKNGVQLETPLKYRTYCWAYGLWVPKATNAQRVAARNYCRSHNGEPYDITSVKGDQARWYCSKLVWASYYYPSRIDLDVDAGRWVTPNNVLLDGDAAIFTKS